MSLNDFRYISYHFCNSLPKGIRWVEGHWIGNFYAHPIRRMVDGALSVTPVRAFVHASVRPLSKFGVRSITFERLHRFKFGMLIYNVKTQVKFDLGYNPLNFDGVMGLL